MMEINGCLQTEFKVKWRTWHNCGAGRGESCWGNTDYEGDGKALWGAHPEKVYARALTFVCNLASCFSSRLVCL